MNHFTEQAVERAIGTMHKNLGQRITIDDLAGAALFSKFHFTRVFKETTGVTPARFLSALRLAEAQRLLISTSATVADISYLVGYNSPGTFSSRFTASVGVSPTRYRQLGGYTSHIPTDNPESTVERRSGTVCGTILPAPEGPAGPTFIGLFDDSVPQGRPLSCAVLDQPGHYVLEEVPEGAWRLLVHSVERGSEEVLGGSLTSSRGPSVGSGGTVRVRRRTVSSANVQLRPMRSLDPPILLAMLDLRMVAMESLAR